MGDGFYIRGNACICERHLPAELLGRYRDDFNELADKYPELLWPLLYQSEVRNRSNNLLRWARKGREAKKAAEPDPFEDSSDIPFSNYEYRTLV